MTTLISDNQTLARLCDRASDRPFITIDTEFIRDKTYWPNLCLVQIAFDDEAACIDTLAPDLDLEPLYDLMVNESVLKVFHAARQDLEIFFHRTGLVPHPIFDTQVAAMVCGFGDQVGYETLVSRLVGARLDKTARFTDWSRRPLTAKQMKYALDDVIHLKAAYPKLKRRLEGNGRSHWLEEEMAVLTAPETYELHPELAWRRLKTRGGKPLFLAILREVAAWREEEAQRRDVPRNRLVRDESLLDLAANAPKSRDEMGRIRGLPRGIVEGPMGAAILEAIARGVALPEDQRPVLNRRPPLPQGLGPLTDLLKVLLKKNCEENEVAPRLVANADDLEQIAADDQADVPALRGWRRELFGEAALALKHGRLALTAADKSVRVIDVERGG